MSTPPTSQRALISGAMSGIAVDFMFFPLDTVKTRIQSSKGFWASGGFKGVYRGVGSVGMGSAPGAAAFFLTYENLKARIPKAVEISPSLNHLVSASGAEFVSCLIRVPTEIVKSRTQTSTYGEGKNSLHSLVTTWRNEGIRGFYRGFGITIGREVSLTCMPLTRIPFTSIQFPLYEGLKTALAKRTGRRPSPGEAAICGSIAGGTAAILTTPLDVVKTRVMLEANAQGPRQSPSILSFPPRLVDIARTQGVSALFGGWLPRTIAISLGGAVFLGIYDFAVNFRRD